MSQADSKRASSSAAESPAGSPPNPRPRRRWFQFHLRTLLIAVLLISVLLAAFVWRRERAQRQAEAVATLGKFQDYCVGYETYEREDPFPFNPETESSIPLFLRDWLGGDFFFDADQVREIQRGPRSPTEVERFWDAVARLPKLRILSIDGKWMDRDGLGRLRNSNQLRALNLVNMDVTNDDLFVLGSLPYLESFFAGRQPGFSNQSRHSVDDRGLADLTNLTRLKFFALSQSRVSSNGIRDFVMHHPSLEQLYLAGDSLNDEVTSCFGTLPKLRRLCLCDSQISDRGLANLAQLQQLEYLRIEGPKITDQGLSFLRTMTQLRELSIHKTAIDGSGLTDLQALQELRTLWIEENAIHDEALPAIARLSALGTLDIGGSKVTDEGIVNFTLPPNLHYLYLYDTQITDRALEALAKHPQLKTLDVRRTKVTSSGVAALKNANPTCNVNY